MSKGKGIVMGLSEMTEGTGIEINDNTKLTSGKLLDIRTTSSNAQNPVSISAPQITNGKVVDISSDGLYLWISNGIINKQWIFYDKYFDG